MPLLVLLTLIASLQWLVVVNIEPDFNSTAILFGNVQMIIILAVYKFINKYVKFVL